MLGVATLTLGSSTAMAIRTQTQYSNPSVALGGKISAISGFSYGVRQCLPSGFLSSSLGIQICNLFLSSKQVPSLSSFTTAVAAVESDQLSSSGSSNQDEATKCHFVVANAKFMLDEEEHFQEVLFERRRLYSERNIERDFWLVVEPKFLDRFPNITKRLKRPAVALVSTNGPWITFMKLRLDRVLQESFEANSLEEALASNPANLEFEKPEKWVAPYPKYESGWWKPFLPSEQKEANV